MTGVAASPSPSSSPCSPSSRWGWLLGVCSCSRTPRSGACSSVGGGAPCCGSAVGDARGVVWWPLPLRDLARWRSLHPRRSAGFLLLLWPWQAGHKPPRWPSAAATPYCCCCGRADGSRRACHHATNRGHLRRWCATVEDRGGILGASLVGALCPPCSAPTSVCPFCGIVAHTDPSRSLLRPLADDHGGSTGSLNSFVSISSLQLILSVGAPLLVCWKLCNESTTPGVWGGVVPLHNLANNWVTRLVAAGGAASEVVGVARDFSGWTRG